MTRLEFGGSSLVVTFEPPLAGIVVRKHWPYRSGVDGSAGVVGMIRVAAMIRLMSREARVSAA